MTCKNCGAELRDNARVCRNCGAFVDDGSGYTLLTSDNRVDDFYSSEPVKKKSGALAYVISMVLVVAIVFGGAYYYFTKIKPQEKPAPQVTFTSGCGIINDNEPVFYAAVEKNTKIQYIHGVKLFVNDAPDSEAGYNCAALLSDKYEYTKNIDDTFRAIFFDARELGNNKNVVFEIKLGFFGDEGMYTYYVPLAAKEKIKASAADAVFDHSNSKKASEEASTEKAPSETTEKKPEETTAQTTAGKRSDVSFVYDSYWFTEPETEGDTRTIYALKFGRDGAFVSTRYQKKGSEGWQVSTTEGSFELKDGMITVTESGRKRYFAVGNNSVSGTKDGKTVQKLIARKYNSIKNVEDFFGL
ncbi:MAG: zinc ribbon domain-containing protein [Eubacterium sp.]|nr:zinc ribbon domain-containing protein [Eubacterium sp.]